MTTPSQAPAATAPFDPIKTLRLDDLEEKGWKLLDAWAKSELGLLPKYENLPRGRYVTLVILRETQSETIFRTEGTGAPLCAEVVTSGFEDKAPIERVVITKRKQIAVERRTGRELLRSCGHDNGCVLNVNEPCERCADCWLYGFAVGGGGAQRSRVLGEDAFSLLPSDRIVATRTFNAIFDNGTMRNPLTGEPSTALSESEYVKPGVHFVDVQVLKDVTPLELLYALGNVRLSQRYGAISSRVGRIENRIVALGVGRAEGPSALELVRALHDGLRAGGLEHPMERSAVHATLKATAEVRLGSATGMQHVVTEEEMKALDALVSFYAKAPKPWIDALATSYPTATARPEGAPKGKAAARKKGKGETKGETPGDPETKA